MPNRRVRVKKEAVVMSPTEKKKLSALLDEYTGNEEEVTNRVARNKDILAEVDKLLHQIGLRDFQTAKSEAKYEVPGTRAKRVIDIRRFREMVSDDDFLACVAVAITKARKVVSERELDAISTTSAPEPKDPVLKINRRK